MTDTASPTVETPAREKKSASRIVTAIVRILLGLMFLVFRLNGFLNFMPAPKDIPPEIMNVMGALMNAGYMTVVSGAEVIIAVMLLTNRFVPLALALLALIIVGILTFHIAMQPATIGPGIVVTVMELYLAWAYRGAFRPMLRTKVSPGADQTILAIQRTTIMSKLRVHCFSISLDGFGAGPNQDLNNPLGVGGEDLHQWLFPTRVFQKMQGKDEGTTGVDNDFAERGFERIGAWILGRNMFGPIRGAWPDEKWKSWWGDAPPYHTPVFVLTHHPRAAVKMDGGTTFHFVTDGIHAALQRAKEEANGLDVRLGGGAATIRQYLQAGLVDELHVAVSPIILGSGESLFGGIDLLKLGYKCAERVTSPAALHMVLTKGTT